MKTLLKFFFWLLLIVLITVSCSKTLNGDQSFLFYIGETLKEIFLNLLGWIEPIFEGYNNVSYL